MRVTPRITLIRGRTWKLGGRKVAASSRLVVMIQDVNQISQSAFRLATCRDACITTCHYISTCCASLGAVALSLLLNCETVAAPQIVKPAYAATLPRPVYESSFWTSKEVYETSHDRTHHVSHLR